MFGSRRLTDECSIILKNMVIKGDIEFNNGLSIKGQVIGNIVANDMDGERTELVLLDGGEINGNIEVPKAHINGKVIGNIKARQLELDKNAEIIGDLSYEVLVMKEGACIDGSIKHLDKKEAGSKVTSISEAAG